MERESRQSVHNGGGLHSIRAMIYVGAALGPLGVSVVLVAVVGGAQVRGVVPPATLSTSGEEFQGQYGPVEDYPRSPVPVFGTSIADAAPYSNSSEPYWL